MRKSDLPFGVNLSPNQIALPRILKLIEKNQGTTAAFTEDVRSEFFSAHGGGNLRSQRDIAKNIRLSLRAYEIVNADEQFTDLGRTLLGLADLPDRLYSELARHILLHLHGLDLLRAVSRLHTLRVSPNLQAIARELEGMGIHVPPSAVHISTMKLWLEKADVVGSSFHINQDRVKELIGISLEDVDNLDRFTPEVRAFVRALAAIDSAVPIPSSKVREHATSMTHVEFFDLKNLREQVIFPLRDLGYIEVTKATSGRGAKAHLIRITPKFRAEFILPVLDALARSGGFPVVSLERPLQEVVAQLSSHDRHQKGLALEMLAMHFCRLLGLRVVDWRRRAVDTGGAEVDLIADGTNYVFTRWQIQCKNTSLVSHDDVARELGIVGYTRANVVLIITTGRIARPAAELAESEMSRSPASLVLLDGNDLKQIVASPSSIGQVLRKHAARAMKLKSLRTSR